MKYEFEEDEECSVHCNARGVATILVKPPDWFKAIHTDEAFNKALEKDRAVSDWLLQVLRDKNFHAKVMNRLQFLSVLEVMKDSKGQIRISINPNHLRWCGETTVAGVQLTIWYGRVPDHFFFVYKAVDQHNV